MCFLFGKKKLLAEQKELNEKIKKLTEQLSYVDKSVKETVINTVQTSNSALIGGVSSTLNEVKSNISVVLENNEKRIAEMRASLDKNLGDIRQDNEKRLGEMRQVVEEKLTTTLSERLSSTVTSINERLDAVNKGLGEMQTLTSGVTDLRKMLGNVKTRGVFGEISLSNILSNILSAEQYKEQYNLSERAADNRRVVDFAVVLPGKKGDENVFLPIDAKFPLEDYQRLVSAAEEGDAEGVERNSKALLTAIRKQAKSIKENYIIPPKTVDFALMYLPIEGLYAEAARHAGLLEELRNKYRVTPVGPTTVTALLNSLQLGFKTLAVQKSGREIFDQLTKFRKDFEKFVEMIQKAQTMIGSVGKTLDEVTKRTDIINKTLDKVERLSPQDAPDENLFLENQ